MKKYHVFILTAALFFQGISLAQAQTDNPIPQTTLPVVEPIYLSGPRVGFTYVGPGKLADKLKKDFQVEPLFTQFGWQFETNYFALPNGTAGLVELVLLAGALEQNRFLPSANMLIGIRSGSGLEFGFGPNLSLAGASFVFAGGFTIRQGALNFPVNIAVVPSKEGFRTSLLVGFNAQKKK